MNGWRTHPDDWASFAPFDDLASVDAAADAELIVVVDLDTLIDGVHDRTVRSTDLDVDLPVDVIRRIACTARIIPVVLNGEGVALDVGRAHRLATPDQRRALRAMYDTCAIPGCSISFSCCQPHHIDYWTRDLGPTDLVNLVPTCGRHHHAVHEGGWLLQLDPDTRRLTVTYPDGTTRHGWPDRRSPPPPASPQGRPPERRPAGTAPAPPDRQRREAA